MSDDKKTMSVEESKRCREAIMKARGLKSNNAVTENEKQVTQEPIQHTSKPETPRYKPVRDHAYAQQSYGLYDMMSGNPILDKIARYWGLHLAQSHNLHLVVSLLLFIGVSMLTSTVLGFITGFAFGVNLFAGLLGIVMFFVVTLPCTTRLIYYGVRYYNKVKYGH